MNKHEQDIKVLKSGTCSTISTKSKVTYQLGTLDDADVYIRISKNTGAGFFNDEWVAVKDIQKALADGPEGQPLTSFLLRSQVKGKSVNTPAFLMAALTHEKLLRVLKGKKRGHEFLDPEGFNARMDRLVASKAKPKGTTSSRKKVVVKKKVMSKRKTPKTT